MGRQWGGEGQRGESLKRWGGGGGGVKRQGEDDSVGEDRREGEGGGGNQRVASNLQPGFAFYILCRVAPA